MKKVKQLAALGLSAVMIAGLCACGDNGGQDNSSTPDSAAQDSSGQESASGESSSEESSSQESVSDETGGEAVTLEWWYRGNGVQKDTELVEDAFNELLKTYPGMENVTVHFNCYTGGEYKNSVILAQSANQQIDILNTVGLDFAEEVGKGSFLALDDYLASNAALKAELPDWLWELGSIDGHTYIVPNYQRAANMMYFITPKDYMDKYGDIDAMREVFQNKDRDVETVAATLEAYCAAVQAGEGAQKYMPSLGTS